MSEQNTYILGTDQEELTRLLKDDFGLFQAYFNIDSYGHWEEENYVLIRDKSDEEIAEKFQMTVPELRA
ncbi:MAG: hypothetical protein COA72_09785, partial [Candidatus Neomarinimicrobiota bacterium]